MINNLVEEEINHCLRDLFNEDQEVRLNAINQLGEIGDELCLQELNRQLQYVNKEYYALSAAVSKLNTKVGVK